MIMLNVNFKNAGFFITLKLINLDMIRNDGYQKGNKYLNSYRDSESHCNHPLITATGLNFATFLAIPDI